MAYISSMRVGLISPACSCSFVMRLSSSMSASSPLFCRCCKNCSISSGVVGITPLWYQPMRHGRSLCRGGKGGEGCIEWRYERIYESKPTRLPRRTPLAAAAPIDLRLGPRRASSGGAGPPGRGAVRALRLSPAAADPRWGTLPAPRRAPAAPGAAPRPHAAPAATPQKVAGEQRPRYAAAPQDHELFGEEIRGIISKHEPFLERKGSTQRTLGIQKSSGILKHWTS